MVYATQIVDLIKELDTQDIQKPWAMVCSFVDPHDEALYGELTKLSPEFNFEVDPTLPYIAPSPSANDPLTGKPRAQASYKEVYQVAFQRTLDTEQYRKLYYTLQKRVDKQISRVLRALKKSKFAENTIIIFTSDHGDYLGAHGLFQKWYSSYEEAIHVPLSIIGPGNRKRKKRDTDFSCRFSSNHSWTSSS